MNSLARKISVNPKSPRAGTKRLFSVHLSQECLLRRLSYS